MPTIQKILWPIAIVLVAIAAIVIAIGHYWSPAASKNAPEPTVTSSVILNRINSGYFIVTKTAYTSQETALDIDQGSTWSNLLWGQKVTARAVVRLDIGVDLSRLNESDIVVDAPTKTVKINVPPADIMNASVFGDVSVETSQGILKRLLENDPSGDRNRAVERLLADAKEAVRRDPQVFIEARRDSLKLLRLIVENTGYVLETTELTK